MQKCIPLDNAYGVIYKIQNKVNNKVYIGQTSKTFNDRYDNGKWWLKTENRHLLNSIKKYGKDNFYIIEKMDIAFTQEELDLKERFYIKMFNANNPENGYNGNGGGRKSTSTIIVFNRDYKYIDSCNGYDEVLEKGYTKVQNAIINVCRGRREVSFGYRFFYEEDVIEMKSKEIKRKDYKNYVYQKYKDKKWRYRSS